MEVVGCSDDGRGLSDVVPFLGPTTFVFEPYMDAGVAELETLGRADVGLYIGTSWARTAQSLRSSMERDSGVVEDFVKARHARRFPRFVEAPNVLDGLMIYWKMEPGENAD